MGESPAITPFQDMRSQQLDDPNNSSMESAIGSKSLLESSEASQDPAGEESSRASPTEDLNPDPAVLDQETNGVVHNTQVGADTEVGNEAITVREEIQRLHRKIEELCLLHHMPMDQLPRTMRPSGMPAPVSVLPPPGWPPAPIPLPGGIRPQDQATQAGFPFGRPGGKGPSTSSFYDITKRIRRRVGTAARSVTPVRPPSHWPNSRPRSLPIRPLEGKVPKM